MGNRVSVVIPAHDSDSDPYAVHVLHTVYTDSDTDISGFYLSILKSLVSSKLIKSALRDRKNTKKEITITSTNPLWGNRSPPRRRSIGSSQKLGKKLAPGFFHVAKRVSRRDQSSFQTKPPRKKKKQTAFSPFLCRATLRSLPASPQLYFCFSFYYLESVFFYNSTEEKKESSETTGRVVIESASLSVRAGANTSPHPNGQQQSSHPYPCPLSPSKRMSSCSPSGACPLCEQTPIY